MKKPLTIALFAACAPVLILACRPETPPQNQGFQGQQQPPPNYQQPPPNYQQPPPNYQQPPPQQPPPQQPPPQQPPQQQNPLGGLLPPGLATAIPSGMFPGGGALPIPSGFPFPGMPAPQ